MTIKEFYKAHKEDETIEFCSSCSPYGINNPFFTTWRQLFKAVDSNIEILHFSLEFEYDGMFNGFLFYVSKEDYQKIKKTFDKQNNI